MKKYLIAVLDDGETWSMASGAKLCEISEGQFKKLEAGEYPKNLKVKGLSLDHYHVTKQDLIDAPMYTVFRGPAEDPKMKYDQWDLFTGDQPDKPVIEEMSKKGIRLIRDIDGSPLFLQKDDELSNKEHDDLDAALAYLNNGGLLAKLPDHVGSPYSRMYAVACYKPVKP